jgi:hypothetical protein
MQMMDELSRRELLALREIREIGRTTDHAMALELLSVGMVMQAHDGHFHLSAEGRRMLVRGSPSLWNIAS